MADNKAESQHSGEKGFNGTTAGHGFLARIGTHFKNWWWLYLIVFIAVVLVVVLPIVFVAYPRIAQGGINDSTLEITQMKITDPKPDSVQLDLTQVIGTHGSLHPTIYGFNASVSLAGSSSPFSSVYVPDFQPEGETVVNISRRMQWSNETAFAEYVKAVWFNEQVQLNVYGTPELKEGGLPTITVAYNKTVTMKGLNSLKGLNITNFNVLLSQQSDGSNAKGTVNLPNPSVMTVEMGNLTMDLSVNGTPIGQSYFYNVSLVPGNNVIPMTSMVNQSLVASILYAKDSPYTTGILPIDIRGNKSVYNGQELPYFSKSLASSNLTVNVDVGKALRDLGRGTLEARPW